MTKTIYSIGYGNRKVEDFIAHLKKYNIEKLIDIRTNPVSRFQPSYNKKKLMDFLPSIGVDYIFLGDELGGKPKDANLYYNGVLDYCKVNQSIDYINGLNKLRAYINEGYTICIMCCETDPEKCHRKTLVGETLLGNGIWTHHIDKVGNIPNINL